jgi:23S rRNA pseudouridine2605 synthase
VSEERLNRFLASCGVASRRGADELITSGRIRVGNVVVTELGTKISPETDVVTFDGRRVRRERTRTILLNKPTGYVTTTDDPEGRPIVTALIDLEEHLRPVGRLDVSTSGALLLTNDGALANAIAHPRRSIEKVYRLTVSGVVSEETRLRMARGLRLDDGMTKPCKVTILERRANATALELVLTEGRNRQVRRMCDAVRHPVRKLSRTKIGFLGLRGLALGQWRELTVEELQRLGLLAGTITPSQLARRREGWAVARPKAKLRPSGKRTPQKASSRSASKPDSRR